MNSILKTVLIVLAVLVVAGAIFFAGYALRGPVAPISVSGPGYDGYGPGMMRGWAGPGMMRSWGGVAPGRGMMEYGPGQDAWGPGMMGRRGWGVSPSANATPLTIDEARQAATQYIQSTGLQRLEVGEVMIFDNNAYVAVKETATGLGAFELLVDPASKVAYPEHGPNMMWNLKYGAINHQGMMGTWQSQGATPTDVSADMPLTADDALAKAQAFLDQNAAGAKASTPPVQFYGYYTFDFERDGKVAGMLSVNGYSGQVFLHTWHGTFIEEAE